MKYHYNGNNTIFTALSMIKWCYSKYSFQWEWSFILSFIPNKTAVNIFTFSLIMLSWLLPIILQSELNAKYQWFLFFQGDNIIIRVECVFVVWKCFYVEKKWQKACPGQLIDINFRKPVLFILRRKTHRLGGTKRH